MANAGPHDEFLSDASTDGDGSFSLEKFYTASSDKKGRQTTVRLHVPPSLLRQIQELVARRTIPEYKTSQDVLRDFLVVGAHFRTEQIDDPDFTRDNDMFRLQTEMQTWLAAKESEKATVDDVERALAAADSPEEKQEIRERARNRLSKIKNPKQRERLERMTW